MAAARPIRPIFKVFSRKWGVLETKDAGRARVRDDVFRTGAMKLHE
jgi:hypothetical protein